MPPLPRDNAQRFMLLLTPHPENARKIRVTFVQVKPAFGNAVTRVGPVDIMHPDVLRPRAHSFWQRLHNATVENRLHTPAVALEQTREIGRELFEILTLGPIKDNILRKALCDLATDYTHRQAADLDDTPHQLADRERFILCISDQLKTLWRFPWELLWVPSLERDDTEQAGTSAAKKGIFLALTYPFIRTFASSTAAPSDVPRRAEDVEGSLYCCGQGGSGTPNIAATHASPLSAPCGARAHRPKSLYWLVNPNYWLVGRPKPHRAEKFGQPDFQGYVHLGHATCRRHENEDQLCFFLESSEDRERAATKLTELKVDELLSGFSRAKALRSVFLLGSMSATVLLEGRMVIDILPGNVVEMLGFQHEASSACCVQLSHLLFDVEQYPAQALPTSIALLSARRKLSKKAGSEKYSENRRVLHEWWKPVLYHRGHERRVTLEWGRPPASQRPVEDGRISVPLSVTAASTTRPSEGPVADALVDLIASTNRSSPAVSASL